MNDKQGFVLYRSFYKPTKGLSEKDKAALFDAIFLYHENGDIPELSPAANMAFEFMTNQFELDERKYKKRCEKNRENVNKRWNTENTKECDRIQSNKKDTKHTDKEKDKEKEKDFIISSYKVLDDRFPEFWKLYPSRNGKKIGKAKTAKLFQKLKPADKEQIIIAVKNYVDSGQLPKDPERFIKADYWREWLEPATPQNDKNSTIQNKERYYGL